MTFAIDQMDEDMHWRERDIIEVLRDSKKLKTTDIIKKVNMSKVTALKYLKKLRYEEKVDYEKIGPTKLWFITDSTRLGEDLNPIKLPIGTKVNMTLSTNRTTLTLEGRVINSEIE